MRQLRPYQREAVDAVRTDWAGGVNRPAVVMPTGTGKTDILAAPAVDAARAGKRVLILAHREELLDQITERCAMHAPELPAAGRVQAGRPMRRRPITTAMVQTLASRVAALGKAREACAAEGLSLPMAPGTPLTPRQRAVLVKLRRREAALPLLPHLVVVDECHHAASPSYMSVLSWAGSFDGVPTLGMTATMTRGDRRGLGDVWQKVSYSKSIKWAIDEGWLVNPIGRAVVIDHMDLDHAKVSKGDYQDGELGDMVAQDVDQIVKAWLEHAADRITVAFVPTIHAADQLTLEFLNQGVKARTVTGQTPAAERREIYGQLRCGEVRVMVNVMVASEGWDCPPVSCVLMARPTKLPGLYQQIVGRGLRTSPETGKRDCLVLDVVGASRTQRLVTLIDLHETAEYDASELPPCEDCECKPCVCPKERDPDGGRVKLQGPAKYEDVELFSSSSLNWLFTRKGVRFVPAKDRLAVIWTEPDGTFSAGHVAARGTNDGQWLGEYLTLDRAFELAEAWALAYDPSTARRDSSWRRGGQPSDKQVAFARGLGIVEPERMNRPRLSDEISIVLASRRLDHAA